MIFLVVISFLYFVFLISSLIGFVFYNKKSKNELLNLNTENLISIVIPFRNESTRIVNLLSSLDNQKNINIIKEIIFVDDHSEDHSYELIQSWIQKSNFECQLISLSEHIGKKHAISFGVKKATGTYIFDMDADVSFGSSFFDEIAKLNAFEKDCNILPVIENTGLIWSQIESSIISLLTIGMANLKIPILANGAGLIFKREVFLDLNPFNDNYNISSGDDLYIIKAFKESKKSFGTIYSNSIYINTVGPSNYNDFISRSLRWSSKMKNINFLFTKFLGLIVLLVNLLFIPSVVFLLISFSKPILLFLIIKVFSDLILSIFAFIYYQNSKSFYYILPMFLFYPLHITIVVILLSINFPNKWKGRNVIHPEIQ